MPDKKLRGAFVVVEGLDRSGKSTQVALLEERLKAEGVPVRLVKFPGERVEIQRTHAYSSNGAWLSK